MTDPEAGGQRTVGSNGKDPLAGSVNFLPGELVTRPRCNLRHSRERADEIKRDSKSKANPAGGLNQCVGDHATTCGAASPTSPTNLPRATRLPLPAPHALPRCRARSLGAQHALSGARPKSAPVAVIGRWKPPAKYRRRPSSRGPTGPTPPPNNARAEAKHPDGAPRPPFED